jgi:hypothetical protein
MQNHIANVKQVGRTCMDCTQQVNESCRLCGRPFCRQHLWKILGYTEHGMVMMCYGCSRAFMEYVQTLVNQRNAVD